MTHATHSDACDKNNNIWFSSWGSGVTKFDGNNFTHYSEKEGLSSNEIYSIGEGQDGKLWFGTLGGGANKFDGKTFEYYTKKEGYFEIENIDDYIRNEFIYNLSDKQIEKFHFQGVLEWLRPVITGPQKFVTVI